jgi:peroxiredoxin Q/BCP
MRFRGAMNHHSAGATFALSAMLAVGCGEQSAQASPLRATIASASEAVTPQVDPQLELGAPAPDVTLTLQDGFGLSLSAMKGKPIAVFFCSAVTDPACATEAEGLRDHWEDLHQDHNLVVVGVSPQAASAHQAFIAQHKLHYDLASDPARQIAQAFKVPVRPGTPPHAILIGRDGKIRATWQTADPERHAREILAAVRD